jgi:ribose transport system permease protein
MSSVTTRPDETERGGVESGSAERRRRPQASGLLTRYAAVLILLVLIVVFSILEPSTFPTKNNATAIFNTQSITLIVALGTMVPLIAGEFDLSVGYVLGFGALLGAKLMSMDVNPILATLLTLMACAAIGTFSGVLVVIFRINAFIATLGVGTALSGFTLWLSGGTVVNGVPTSFVDFGRLELSGFQMPLFFAIGVVIVFHILFNHMPLGRYMYAIGGGREAARLAGIATGRLRILAFTAAATIAGLAGVLQTATTGSASPDFGPSFLLPAFAACFLGATVIKPGRFNTLGTVVALLLLAVGIDGLQLGGAPYWVGPVFNGTALLLAVGLSVSRSVSQATD